jgi:hypothetical protein
MKTAGWAGLFIASFLVGHFVANPWLYPVGKILLFIEIYLSALAAFIILHQVIPYIWRTLSKWQVDFQQNTGIKEQNLSGGMRLSFAAAGLSSAMERGKEEANPQPEPMPRNLATSGAGATSTAVTLLTATVAAAATGKKEDCWKEPAPPRKLVLLPPIKANPEKNPDSIISGENEECPDESTASCEAVTEDKVNKEVACVVDEMAAVITLEDMVDTESTAIDEAVHAPHDDIMADMQETSIEPADGVEQVFSESVTMPNEAETGTAEIIALVEVPEELRVEELEYEELEPLVNEYDISVESIPPAWGIPLAFRRQESEALERILAVDATGIAAETMDSPEEILMDEISFEAEGGDFAAEGTDLSFFSGTILRGGVVDGSADQVAAANEEIAEIIEIAEVIEVGANIMAAEESVGSCRAEQDFLDNGSVHQQYQELELSWEQSGEYLAMDNSPESEFECISMEETSESSGFDICEIVELAETEPILPISIEVDSFEPTGCVDIQPIEAATTEEAPETVIVDDIIELRPVGAEISIHSTRKDEERFIPMPHSYSCRLRCQKPGGIFQGPVLSFYCRFICQHGNY